MNNLSPTTRAIYDAFNRVGFFNEPSFETDRKALAASLRALADCARDGDGSFHASEIFTFADELDAVEPFDEEENDRRFKECRDIINNLKPGEIEALMGPEFMAEFRRVSK